MFTPQRSFQTRPAASLVAAAALASISSIHAAENASDKFLADIQNENADVRFAAWSQAGKMDAKVVQPLAKLLAHEKPGVVKAVGEALKVLAHSAGKEAANPKRKEISKELVASLSGDQPVKARTTILRCLSLIAVADSVSAVEKWMADKDLREEAVYCLERTPGKEATDTLIRSLKSAPDDFKPRIMAALGHRKDKAAMDVLDELSTSTNTTIVISAIAAIGRIGVKPAKGKMPGDESLSPRDKRVFIDSVLRFADAELKNNPDESLRWYKYVLTEGKEKHFQCAAVIGLAKINRPDAAEAVVPLLANESPAVRSTTKKALMSMKGPEIDSVLQKAAEKAEGETKKALEAIRQSRGKQKK